MEGLADAKHQPARVGDLTAISLLMLVAEGNRREFIQREHRLPATVSTVQLPGALNHSAGGRVGEVTAPFWLGLSFPESRGPH